MNKWTEGLKKPALKVAMTILYILPIIPISLNIIYLNKYSGLSDGLRMSLSLILVFSVLSLTMFGLYVLKTHKPIGNIVLGLLSILIISGSSYTFYVNYRVYNTLSNMTSGETIMNYDFVSLADQSYETYEDLQGATIGIPTITNEKVKAEIDAFFDSHDLLDEVTFEILDTPFDLVKGLYEKELDAILIGDGYEDLFNEQLGYENIETDTRILDEVMITVVEDETDGVTSYTSLTEEPFSVLLMGVDSEDEGMMAAARADSLILATVNPTTLSVTMTSVPRDSYVPIACFNGQKDKITHANNGGTQCVIDTVSDLFEVDIPYYVKINFKGFVQLIDAMGGIEVDVPYSFSEQNSDREFGDSMIHLEEGVQILDGEEALALARHRKTLANGDLGRAESQQLVINAAVSTLLTKLTSINELLNIMDVLGDNVDTNFSIGQLTSSFEYVLDLIGTYGAMNPMDYIHIKNMVLSANFGNMYSPLYGLELNYAFPFEGALYDAKKHMYTNLELIEPELFTNFTFDPFVVYKGTSWVHSFYSESLPNEVLNPPTLVPDFVSEGWTKEEVVAWGFEHDIHIDVYEINEGESGYFEGAKDMQVATQSVSPDQMLSASSSLTIGVIVKPVNCAIPENQTSTYCRDILPDMVAKQYTADMARDWAATYGIPISVNLISVSDANYNPKQAGFVSSQSVAAYTQAYDIAQLTVNVMDYFVLPDFNAPLATQGQIQEWGNKMGVNISFLGEQYFDVVPAGNWVVSQAPGTLLGANTTISVTLSKGAKPTEPVQPTCGEGEELVEGVCQPKPVVPPTCGEGEELVEGVCQPKPVAPPTCTEGETLVEGVCQPSSSN